LQLHLYEEAIVEAATSVENIARALLYCYGDKPNPDAGQEEPLQMLSARLKGSERITVEKIIENVSEISHNRNALKKLESRDLMVKRLDGESTRQLVERASSVVSELQRFIGNRFRLEIPELTTQGASP
jgi:hypothetical protein